MGFVTPNHLPFIVKNEKEKTVPGQNIRFDFLLKYFTTNQQTLF